MKLTLEQKIKQNESNIQEIIEFLQYLDDNYRNEDDYDTSDIVDYLDHKIYKNNLRHYITVLQEVVEDI